MTLDELRSEAAEVGRELGQAADSAPPELRARFIAIRTELIRRGIFDPILIRFDTATTPKAPAKDVAEELKTIAGSLTE